MKISKIAVGLKNVCRIPQGMSDYGEIHFLQVIDIASDFYLFFYPDRFDEGYTKLYL